MGNGIWWFGFKHCPNDKGELGENTYVKSYLERELIVSAEFFMFITSQHVTFYSSLSSSYYNGMNLLNKIGPL